MKFILPLIALFLNGCSNLLSTGMNINTAYDLYSISKDERGVVSIAKDKLITTKFQAKILASENLSNFNLDIHTFYGTTTIIGEIENKEQKDEILKIADSIDGIKKVQTYLLFKDEARCSASTNLTIFLKIKNDLIKDSLISSTNIRVNLVGCHVVFSGVVNSIEQEKRAIWYAFHTPNVADIYSFLQILE